jgi:hypothetical protein
MNLPRFSAEASLYQANGHYQTPRQSISLPTQMIGTIHLSMEPIEWPGGGEVIPIQGGCAPGWTDIGGTCWPNPLTEPSAGDGGTPGGPFGEGPRDGGGGGGGSGSESGSGSPRPHPKKMKCECPPGCEQNTPDPCKLVIDDSQTGSSTAWCEGSCHNSEINPCGGCVMEPA